MPTVLTRADSRSPALTPAAAAAALALAFAAVAITSTTSAAGTRPRATAPETGASHGALPAGLPSHFGIGLSAEPDATGLYGWVPDSGVPFDYVYQYLAGGVNTGQGWRTWNSAAQFPLFYAQGAAEDGAIPVFSYYQLLQSAGPCSSCEEARRDLAHLNAPSIMKAYYADFAMLMKGLGPGSYGGVTGYGGTAIVQVEPDLSGYAEQAVLDNRRCFRFCTGRGNDPAMLDASVASSGYAAVAGYPDTYQGFNLALLHLRDRFAPNVLLAFHVSGWATLYDVDSSTDPSLDASTLGTTAGTFAALAGAQTVRAGTSAYDLVFNDVADRDAGFHKYVDGSDVFWDRLNVAVPNFHRWEDYVGAAVAAAGRPALVWQIPLGNQYFETENDTWGHYQDNRAEYFFGHVGELRAAGVIGLLFGAGNAGSTTNVDTMGDGVTNPPATCTSDGVSSGQVCADHPSTVSDDDGGYLRMAAAAYYQSPVPLG